MERHNEPPIAVVLQPYHDLGLGVGRYLSRRGARVVAVDSDPVAGEAFCRRLSWEGGLASYRFAAAEQDGAGASLHNDLELVYGRVDWLISFLAGPRRSPGRRQSDPLSQLIERQVAHRLEVLKALAPLLEKSAHGTMTHVSLGVAPESASEVAAFWERLLADRWPSAGISTRSLATAAGPRPPGVDSSPDTPGDIERVIAALGWDAGTAAAAAP